MKYGSGVFCQISSLVSLSQVSSELTPEYGKMRHLYFFPQQDGPLHEEAAVPIIAQFLSALEYVHGKGILHRDLKPANLLLTEGE